MILATRHGAREIRAFPQTMSNPPSRSAAGYASGQVRVDAAAAAGLPAVDAAIRGASEAVACLTLRVWRGEGTERRRVTTTWQARLLAQSRPNPAQTWFELWETLEASMTARRNAFLWRDVADGRAVGLWALHPDQVAVGVDDRDGSPRYRVMVGGGWIDPTRSAGRNPLLVEAGPDVVLHAKGPGGGGTLVAPSPVEVFRASLGAAIAQQASQEAFYSRGTAGGHVIVFPQDLPARAVREAKALWDESNAGVGNAHGTRVLSGGATITPVTVSQSDAQFVETAQLSIDDAARIFQWPASLIGGGAGVGQRGAPLSPEHEMTRMVRYCLTPRLRRWEAILAADPVLFGPGSRDYPAFDREGLIRADVQSQSAADAQLVQAGILLVDEARALRGQPPLPNGWGQIPQIIPVGGTAFGVPDPNVAPPVTSDPGGQSTNQAAQEG
jgi:HK97 family phage portal protein